MPARRARPRGPGPAGHVGGNRLHRTCWASEILNLKLECLGRYNRLPMLWHDQTKVGNYDQAIRIPEPLYTRLTERQRKTLAHSPTGTAAEKPPPRNVPNWPCSPPSTAAGTAAGHCPTTGSGYHFRAWIKELDLGLIVPHQARHTLATRLLRHGASLTHIRRYLGQVSDRMAEHYAQAAVSEIEDVLQDVWVAGPGAANPRELLSGTLNPLNRHQAEALAIDLSSRSTPAEGGFLDLPARRRRWSLPLNLDSRNREESAMSGATRPQRARCKREQWHSIAERAPDDATADYLHEVFAPTARAIDGLEKALAGLNLLDDALALDLLRPQDYFQRLWSTGFRAAELALAADDDGDFDEAGQIPA